jgi:hypothetical protein
MFVQIAPHVKVFLTKEQVAFVEKYQHKESFTDRSLSPEEAHSPGCWVTRPYSSGRNLTVACNML